MLRTVKTIPILTNKHVISLFFGSLDLNDIHKSVKLNAYMNMLLLISRSKTFYVFAVHNVHVVYTVFIDTVFLLGNFSSQICQFVIFLNVGVL